MLQKTLIFLWLLVIGLLFFYSFVQVDLGLTLTRASFFQTIQKSFQYIGYFNRPLSALLISIIYCLLTSIYLWTLYLVWKKKLQAKTIWIITILASCVLLFSYNAFSYDLFNYIFDAKIFTHYHLNPYSYKALDFPGDPMLGFMHWTHRTYPYGPSWIALTVPLSFLGGGYFLITFYLFKALVISSYIGSCYLIEKIARKTKLINPTFALAVFALNPMVIIETLVSAHNEMPMMFFALLAVYFMFENKKVFSLLSILASIGVKFATLFLAPLFLWYPFSKNKNRDFIFFLGGSLFMLGAVYFASVRTTFQPWYLLFALPFTALISNKYYILIPSVLFSILSLFQYLPYIYTGNYDPPIPSVMNQMLWWSIITSIILTATFGLYKKFKS